MSRATFKGSPTEKLLNKLWGSQCIRTDTTAKEAYALDSNDVFSTFTWAKFKNSYTSWRKEKIKELDAAKNPTGPADGM